MRKRTDPRNSGALQSRYQEKLRSCFYGEIVPRHEGHVTLAAFQEYLMLLRGLLPYMPRGRRAIEEEIQFAMNGICVRAPALIQG